MALSPRLDYTPGHSSGGGGGGGGGGGRGGPPSNDRGSSGPLGHPKAPSTPKAPAPKYDVGGGGGYTTQDVGGGGGGGGGAPSEEDYLKGDSAYQAQLSALQKALADFSADNTAQQGKYQTSYDDSLRGLGWQNGMADDPMTADVDETTQGGWNFNDQNTAAGRSYQNQLNDFAGRGMLQSSGYGTALDGLTRSLNDQHSSMDTAKQSFFDDLARQLSTETNQNTMSTQQAKADAIARRAAQYGL